MRKIMIMFLLLSAITGISAQYGNSPYNLEAFVNKEGKFLMQIGDDGSIAGSRYLSDEYSKGKVFLEGNWYEDAALNFDIFNGRFELKLTDNVFIIDPVKNYADSVEFNDEVFVRRDMDPGKKIRMGYLVLLNDNNGVSLCKQYRIRLDPPRASDGYSEAQPAKYATNTPRYYVYKESDIWEVDGLKSVAEMFDVDSKTIKKYMKENKYKLSREGDMTSIIDHLSE